MVSWDGDFNWQSYALQGRPDVLNYLHRGDVSWEGLWSFYRTRAASPEAVMAVMNLIQRAGYTKIGLVGLEAAPAG